MAKNKLKVIFLGGVEEIGKNMTALEYGKQIIIIDAGVAFPTADLLGVDLVIPNFTYLKENAEKIVGLFLTHGHEDHIGAVPYLLKEINVPIYGTKFTLSLLDNKLKEHKLNDVKLNAVKEGSIIKAGDFSVEFIHVNHSIAGACALAIKTPVGMVYHTGDYKIDYTPVDGNIADLRRIAEIGDKGVLLMLGESTNVEHQGHSLSERRVGFVLDRYISENPEKRVIIATFSTNIHRIKQILDVAKRYNRKVAFSGRSMVNIVEVAKKTKEIEIPDDLIVDIDKIKKIADKNLIIISTGSQGEPMSALTRMASDEYVKVTIGDNDLVILSSSPIPGNEKMVYEVINNLYKKGAKVIYDALFEVHASGHSCQDEMKLILSLIKPKFFIPVHGEYRHLKQHALLAEEMGIPKYNILIPKIGTFAELTSNSMVMKNGIVAGSLLVDGSGLGEKDSIVLRDRKHLSEDGIIIILISLNENGMLECEPDVISRGFAYSTESDMIEQVKDVLAEYLSSLDLKDTDTTDLKAGVRKCVKNFVYRKTMRSPMILPLIV